MSATSSSYYGCKFSIRTNGRTGSEFVNARATRCGGTVVYRDMRKLLPVLSFLALTLWAANVKLYMTDGTYHIVREYQVQPDRVHFYSVERSQWEDVPLDLVDLKRTNAEAAARQSKLEEDSKVIEAEEKAERELEKERTRIPQDPGVYWLEGKQARVLKQAESTVHTNKGRSILKRLAPIPVVSGKGTLELQGASSLNIF